MESHNFSNQQQEQICRRLKFLVGPGAAAFYRDACRLMEMEPLLESTTHLVGHLLREIESSLRAVLKHIWELSEQSSKKKKASNENTHEAQIRTVLQALEIPEASIVAQTWLSLPGKNSEYGLHTRAHRNDLSQPRSVDQEFRQFWGDIQAVLDQLLDRFEARYSDIRGRLDELLSKPEPGDEDLKMLRLHIPNSLTGLGYFFEQLQFPGWLKKLREEGFFKNPPEPEVNSEGGGKRFFPWSQSRYLAQMASHEPEIVLDIALEILETQTKNVFVHEDLAQAALAMPPELAARWVEKETELLREQDYLDDNLADKFCELVNYLTHENQVDTALSLLRELLAVLPASQSSSSLGEPSTRLNEYYYNELLQNNVPKLREVAGEDTFKMLCDLLEEAVRLSASPDYSHHWRASIKDNPNGIRELLISAVRDATEHLAENNPVAVRTLVPVLESYNRTIFQRLSLHLLCRFPNESQELIEERLTNCERFQNQGELYEYKLLMKEQFSNLSSEAQETIFTWIAEGAIDKPSLSAADRALYIKSWQRGWLAILSDYLTGQLQQQYEQLVSELGPVEPLEPVGGIRLLKVSRSPKTSAELASMSMTELLAFLKQWQPSGNLLEPSRNGLGCELFQVITQNPEAFVRESEQFKELDTEYKRWFLCGLRQALTTYQQRQGFPWFEILEFCSWILAQQHQTSECEVPNSAIDREWNQTCEAVIDVITEGLQATAENQIPLELRTQVWTILEQLTDDPKVTPGFEAQYRYSNARPIEASVSTVRGKAMHTVVQYALWVKQHLQKEEERENQAARDFDEIPEVWKVLERHLDPEQDPSLVIRSVYGKCLTDLMNLDSDWITKNLGRIFPKNQALHELRAAAWEGYVTSYPADTHVFTILREEYSQAIERLGMPTHETQYLSEFDQLLPKHLIQLYWNGELELGAPDRLLESFFEKAPELYRECFMRNFGWLLSHNQSEVTPELLERLQRLWEWRIGMIYSSSASAIPTSELKTFGLWFTSGKFENKWASAQLMEVLKLSKDVNDDRNVLRCLANIAPSIPREAIKCLALIANGSRAKWLIYGEQESSRAILSTSLQSGDEETCNAAIELINRLLARNYADFRNLLPNGVA